MRSDRDNRRKVEETEDADRIAVRVGPCPAEQGRDEYKDVEHVLRPERGALLDARHGRIRGGHAEATHSAVRRFDDRFALIVDPRLIEAFAAGHPPHDHSQQWRQTAPLSDLTPFAHARPLIQRIRPAAAALL